MYMISFVPNNFFKVKKYHKHIHAKDKNVYTYHSVYDLTTF